MATPFTVMFMSAESTPRVPASPRSYDAVSIMNTLHHVAERTPAVLRQAAEISRKYILITEDFCATPTTTQCRWLTQVHDRAAIYRNETEWRALFQEHASEFEVVRTGRPLYKRTMDDVPSEIVAGVTPGLGRSHNSGQAGQIYMVLRRRGNPDLEKRR